MAQQPERIVRRGGEAEQREADRARLLERVAVGLAHEAKNPLHNMVLHIQLIAEKVGGVQGKTTAIDKHLTALRDGIGRVDALLKSFGEFAAPEHLPPDLPAAVARATQLFTYEARRAGVQLVTKGPATLLVSSEPRPLGDIVAHALVAAVELSREGGTVELDIQPRGAAAALQVRGEGGFALRDQAEPHLAALHRLAAEAQCELSIETPPAGGARLSLTFLLPR
ncbi:MAG: HAMP domain-containing histidine kinase [Deltaproteobacteria bacterium]|nr:MAG: HAMP domain-containing histidine kinase [Deltaproteobacteria bacterium]